MYKSFNTAKQVFIILMNKTRVFVFYMVRMLTNRLSGFTYVLAQIFRGQSVFIPFASHEKLVIENNTNLLGAALSFLLASFGALFLLLA
jgi:hypothetical protein